MSSFDDSRYGGNWWPVFRANWQDKRSGQYTAALARKGYLRAPQGEGKIVWIKAGGKPDSVRLACEILGLIRERRLDIRLVLTFEHDYAEIIAPRVKGMRKIGLGYGPSDRPHSVKRVMTRLNPFGLILVDTVPHPNLLHAALANKVHVIAYNTLPTPAKVEAAYPVDLKQSMAWRTSGMTSNLLESADPASLFAEAQVDTTLRSMLRMGQDDMYLWWWHDDLSDSHDRAVSQWRFSALARNGVLFVSGKDLTTTHLSANLSISNWDRGALPAGSVILVDDSHWFAALSSAVTGAYVNTRNRNIFWQSLVGGCAFIPGMGTHDMFPGLPLPGSMPSHIPEIYAAWLSMLVDPRAARNRGDKLRRFFWEERRRVHSALEDLVKHVFDW